MFLLMKLIKIKLYLYLHNKAKKRNGEKSMKVCKYCGYEGDCKFCPNCGNLMQEISTNDNNEENKINDSEIDKKNIDVEVKNIGISENVNKLEKENFTSEDLEKDREIEDDISSKIVNSKNNRSKIIRIVVFITIVIIVTLGLYIFNSDNKDVRGINLFDENGYALAKQGDKYGFINKEGKYVINPQFKILGDFSEGLVYASSDGEEYGFIDKTGKYTINPQFDEAYSFSEGLAAVKVDEKWGYINKNEEFVISPQFDRAYNFFDNLACVVSGDKYGYIDMSGNYVINPQFLDAQFIFTDELAYVYKDGRGYGFIDKEGQFVIYPQFYFTGIFMNGIANVEINEKWGIINKNGEYIVNPQFDFLEISDNGLIEFSNNDDKYGYINAEGEIVINPIYYGGTTFYNDGYAVVTKKNKKRIIIDEKGEQVSNAEFDGIGSLTQDLCAEDECYRLVEDDNEYCYDHEFDYDYSWSYD